MQRLLISIFAVLLLYACAGEKNLSVSDPAYRSDSFAIPSTRESIETDNPGAAGQGVIEPQKTVQAKPSARKSNQKKSALKESSGEGPGISLFAGQEEGDDENIALLLSPDYLRQFDIPIVFNDAVQYFVRYFTVEKRKIFVNWLRRSRRYVPMIRQILREHGLPEDLIYLAMIESGFNPRAYSPAKACGPWQFIYETGGRYGLRVNHWIDERRDPEKSTVAAALYLKDLFNQFGSWYLAAAGYNAGEKRIERAIEKHETTDFWEISRYNTLPRETREYIPKLIAAAIVAKDPEKFGLTGLTYDQPIRFVTEKVPPGTPMTLLARCASTDVVTIRALNPEILTGITPLDTDYMVKLPETTDRERFRQELAMTGEKGKKIERVVSYTVKRRDTLPRIMKRYGVTYDDLILVNSCDQELKARPGTVVYIPNFSSTGEPVEVAQEEPKQYAHSERARKPRREEAKLQKKVPQKKDVAVRNDYHIVKKGESLAGISERYGVDVATLKALNRIKRDHQIYPNMRLDLVSHVKPGKKPIRRYHVVRRGESLTGIAEKYETDVDTLKRMNGLKKVKVRPGTKLKVPGDDA